MRRGVLFFLSCAALAACARRPARDEPARDERCRKSAAWQMRIEREIFARDVKATAPDRFEEWLPVSIDCSSSDESNGLPESCEVESRHYSLRRPEFEGDDGRKYLETGYDHVKYRTVQTILSHEGLPRPEALVGESFTADRAYRSGSLRQLMENIAERYECGMSSAFVLLVLPEITIEGRVAATE